MGEGGGDGRTNGASHFPNLNVHHPHLFAAFAPCSPGILQLTLMKVSNIHKMKQPRPDEMDESESESEDEEDRQPVLTHQSVNHRGAINRVKVRRPLARSLWARGHLVDVGERKGQGSMMV